MMPENIGLNCKIRVDFSQCCPRISILKCCCCSAEKEDVDTKIKEKVSPKVFKKPSRHVMSMPQLPKWTNK